MLYIFFNTSLEDAIIILLIIILLIHVNDIVYDDDYHIDYNVKKPRT